jgi:2'-phosphotransferase
MTATAQALSANDPESSHYLIRATQGHSIKTIEATSLLQPLSISDDSSALLPDTVVHGTYHAAWPKILATGGLRCMGRNHIHFAIGPPLSAILPDGPDGKVAVPPKSKGAGGKEGIISGMRSDAQILIYIDLKRAMKAGCPFWRSENGVILSEGLNVNGDGHEKIVGAEFFDVVVERKNGLGIIWENGAMVKETPEWMLNARNPKGARSGGGNDRVKGKEKGKAAPCLRVEKETDWLDER